MTLCAPALDAWCNANCVHAKSHGDTLVAKLDVSAGTQQRAWRCYAPSTLGSDGRYVRGSDYCTRHKQLLALLHECTSPFTVNVGPFGQTSPTPPLARPLAPPPAKPPPPPPRTLPVSHEGLVPWPSGDGVLTLPSVDTRSWSPKEEAELLRVHAWEVPCIDSVKQHKLRNVTGNVSRKKAFLSREEPQP